MGRNARTGLSAQEHLPILRHAGDLVRSSRNRPKRASRVMTNSKTGVEHSKPTHSSDLPMFAATKKQDWATQEAQTEQNTSKAAEPQTLGPFKASEYHDLQSLTEEEEVSVQNREGSDQEDGIEVKESDSEEEGEEGKMLDYLGEDYYEVEAIRKKRVKKGEVQFLVKWQGWPETANTWEPYKNVIKCIEILEEFEKRRRKRPGRRSKRRHVTTHTKQHKEHETKRDADFNFTVSAPLCLGTEENESTKTSSAIVEDFQAIFTGNLLGDVLKLPETDKVCTGENVHATIESINVDSDFKVNSRLLMSIESTRVPATTALSERALAEENVSLLHEDLQGCFKEEKNSTKENENRCLYKENGGVIIEPKMSVDTEQVLNDLSMQFESVPSVAAPTLSRILVSPTDKEDSSPKHLGNYHRIGAKKRKSVSVKRVGQNPEGFEEIQSTKTTVTGENLQGICAGKLTGNKVLLSESDKICTGEDFHATIESTIVDSDRKVNSRLLTSVESTRVPVTTDLTLQAPAEENACLPHQNLHVYPKEVQNSITEFENSCLNKEDEGIVVKPKMLVATEEVSNVSDTLLEALPSVAPTLTRIFPSPTGKEDNSPKGSGNELPVGARKRKSGLVKRATRNPEGTEQNQSTKTSSAIGAICTGNLIKDGVVLPGTDKICISESVDATVQSITVDSDCKVKNSLQKSIGSMRVPVTTDLTLGMIAEQNVSLPHQDLQVHSKEAKNSWLDKEDGGVVVEHKMLVDTEQVWNIPSTLVGKVPPIAAPVLTRIFPSATDKDESSPKHLANGPWIGAKKRVSGSVNRVSENETGHFQEAKAFYSENIGKDNDNVSGNGDLNDKIEQCISEPRIVHPVLKTRNEDSEVVSTTPKAAILLESPIITPYVREIVKAVSYKTSTVNGKHHVIVLFKALRSDGQEVIVDNKFLRDTCPLLLLDFYEQHLRYSTSY